MNLIHKSISSLIFYVYFSFINKDHWSFIDITDELKYKSNSLEAGNVFNSDYMNTFCNALVVKLTKVLKRLKHLH